MGGTGGSGFARFYFQEAFLRERFELLLREIGFCFVKLRPVGSCTADFGELGVKRLRVACVAGGLRGASGAKQTVEAVRRILQNDLVFGKGFGGTLEFEEHVREHFARGDANRFAAILVLTVSSGAQFLQCVIRFPLGKSQPCLSFAEVGGFFAGNAVTLFSRALLAFGNELRQFFDVSFRAGDISATGSADGSGPIDRVQPIFVSRWN